MTPVEETVLRVVEGHAGDRAYGWPGNASIADRIGRTRRAVQLILDSLETKGWILRVMVASQKKSRLGIVLLKRIDPDRPVADPDTLADVIGALERARHEARLRRSRAKKIALWRAQSPALCAPAPRAQGIALEERSLSSKDEATKEDARPRAGKVSPPGRQRPEAPAPAPVPELVEALSAALEVPQGPAEAPRPSPATSPRPAAPRPPEGPRARRRAPCWSLPTEAIASDPALATDPILAGELARRMDTRPEPDPPPAADAPTEELLGALAWCRAPAIVSRACHALIRDLGDSAGLWRAHLRELQAAWEEPGRRRPGVPAGPRLADGIQYAYRKATGPKARCPGRVYKVELDRWKVEHGYLTRG